MCLCMLVGPVWWVILLAGAVSALLGGLRLGGRALGVALLCIGVVSGFYCWLVWFAAHRLGARLNTIGWVFVGVLAGAAVIGVVGGLIITIRPGRGRRSPRGEAGP